jgi:hypothetical protein
VEVENSDERDRKVTQLLTHTLPLIIGGILGIVVFFVYFFKSGQTSVFRLIYQVFLFGTIGTMCVGIPMAFFVLAERVYYYYLSNKNEKYRTIQKYKVDRDDYEFWKIRKDENFWRTLDGLSVEKEVLNVYMHKGYELKTEFETAEGERDHVLADKDDLVYIDFRTDTKIEDTEYLDALLENKQKAGANRLLIYSKLGFSKDVREFAGKNNIELLMMKDIIKLINEIGK